MTALTICRRRIFFFQRLRIHAERAKAGEAGIERGIVNLVGMKLLIDPFIEADGHDAIDVAGARAEGETVQGVDDTLAVVQLHLHLRGGCLLLLLLIACVG